MYFNSVSITVLACISVSITVIVNGFDLFQLTDISVSVNWNNTENRLKTEKILKLEMCFSNLHCLSNILSIGAF